MHKSPSMENSPSTTPDTEGFAGNIDWSRLADMQKSLSETRPAHDNAPTPRDVFGEGHKQKEPELPPPDADPDTVIPSDHMEQQHVRDNLSPVTTAELAAPEAPESPPNPEVQPKTHEQIVGEAKEVLTGFSSLKLNVKRLWTEKVVGHIETSANRRISREGRRVARLAGRLGANERKLARKEERILEHANLAQHGVVRERRLAKLTTLDSLRDTIAEQAQNLAARQEQIEEKKEARDTSVASKQEDLRSLATDLLDKKAVKLAEREMKRDLRAKGYNRTERALVMEQFNETHRRALGGAALNMVRLDTQEHAAIRKHGRVESELTNVASLSDRLYNQLKQTDSNIETTIKQIEELNVQETQLRDQLSELEGTDVSSIEYMLAHQEASDARNHLLELHRDLEDAKQRRVQLDRDLANVSKRLKTAQEDFLGSKAVLRAKQQALNEQRLRLHKEMEAIKSAIR